MQDKFQHIRQELQKVKIYEWPKKQDDSWDRLSGFVYGIQDYSEIIKNIKGLKSSHSFLDIDFEKYTICRWYNFWTSKVIEEYIFWEHKRVQPEKDRFHKYIDFYIEGINFDLKCSVFPNKFKQNALNPINFAIDNPSELITWLYLEQSQQGRWHISNRLFIVFIDLNNLDESWRLKKQFSKLKYLVDLYLNNFNKKLFMVNHQKIKSNPLSDIIFFVKDKEKFEGIFYSWDLNKIIKTHRFKI